MTFAGIMIIVRGVLNVIWGIAGLNLIAALSSIRAYPFWALVVIGIDVAVIYGLTAYGQRLETA